MTVFRGGFSRNRDELIECAAVLIRSEGELDQLSFLKSAFHPVQQIVGRRKPEWGEDELLETIAAYPYRGLDGPESEA